MTISIEQRERVREALRKWQRETRPGLPTCGARTRTTGEPCRQIAMANGRCYVHGGRTPKGVGWHKQRWPNGDAPDAEEKLRRKLKDVERAAMKRAARLAAMTPQERERHEHWQRTHKPGHAVARAADRARRKQAADIRAIIEREPAPPSDDIQRAIDELERRAAAVKVDIFS